jgi:RNA polymerase sigma factor (TIGR02999 family)
MEILDISSPDPPGSSPGEVTELLNRCARGDKPAEQQLLPMIYKELRRIAAHHLRQERPDHTLQATALVHEAYLRMTGLRDTEWKSRTHFFAVAAQVMRHVLADYGRGRKAEKRGGGMSPIPLTDDLAVSPTQCLLIVEIDAALTRLERLNARQAKVVELRFFAGLNEEEIAELLAVSVRTVKRDWTAARAWIYGELHG